MFHAYFNICALPHNLLQCVKAFYHKYVYFPSPVLFVDDDTGNKAPPLLPQPLHNFSREVMELLKYSPLCKVDYHKFATEYHHKFNKQCRVADYGFLKLSELFDAITQSVQVTAENNGNIPTFALKNYCNTP